MKCAVIDLETTGLNLKEDRIIEVACLMVDTTKVTEQIIEERSALINPKVPVTEIITEITGITQEMVEQQGGDFTDVFPAIFDGVADCEVVLGHNIINFDYQFLGHEFKRHGLAALGRMIPIARLRDTMVDFKARRLGLEQHKEQSYLQFAQAVLNRRVYGLKTNLDEVCRFYRVEIDAAERHRAAGDAWGCLQVWDSMGRPV